MAAIPQLSSDARRVVQILLDRNAIRGGELLRHSKLNSKELSVAVSELRKVDLVEVSGDLNEPNLPFATFSVRPSATEYLRFLLQQS